MSVNDADLQRFGVPHRSGPDVPGAKLMCEPAVVQTVLEIGASIILDLGLVLLYITGRFSVGLLVGVLIILTLAVLHFGFDAFSTLRAFRRRNRAKVYVQREDFYDDDLPPKNAAQPGKLASALATLKGSSAATVRLKSTAMSVFATRAKPMMLKNGMQVLVPDRVLRYQALGDISQMNRAFQIESPADLDLMKAMLVRAALTKAPEETKQEGSRFNSNTGSDASGAKLQVSLAHSGGVEGSKGDTRSGKRAAYLGRFLEDSSLAPSRIEDKVPKLAASLASHRSMADSSCIHGSSSSRKHLTRTNDEASVQREQESSAHDSSRRIGSMPPSPDVLAKPRVVLQGMRPRDDESKSSQQWAPVETASDWDDNDRVLEEPSLLSVGTARAGPFGGLDAQSLAGSIETGRSTRRGRTASKRQQNRPRMRYQQFNAASGASVLSQSQDLSHDEAAPTRNRPLAFMLEACSINDTQQAEEDLMSVRSYASSAVPKVMSPKGNNRAIPAPSKLAGQKTALTDNTTAIKGRANPATVPSPPISSPHTVGRLRAVARRPDPAARQLQLRGAGSGPGADSAECLTATVTEQLNSPHQLPHQGTAWDSVAVQQRSASAGQVRTSVGRSDRARRRTQTLAQLRLRDEQIPARVLLDAESEPKAMAEAHPLLM
jgi:hypothetical protein